MITSSVWNTRAKTDVPQKTRAVQSHRTPENRFSSASVHFRTPSSSPRAKKERKRERKKERDTYPYILYILIMVFEYFLSIFPRDFFPIFWRLLHNKHIDIIPQQRRKEGDRHACLDERRSGAVQAHRGKCRRRRRRATPRVTSKARRRERDSMHAGQEEAERRVRV